MTHARTAAVSVPTKLFCRRPFSRRTFANERANHTMASKQVRGTTIAVQSLAEAANPQLQALRSIEPDDAAELRWIDRLRPLRSLIRPADAFAQGIRRLSPAVDFDTYDAGLARSNRAAKRARQNEVTEERRRARVTPSVMMKNALDARRMAPENRSMVFGEEGEGEEAWGQAVSKNKAAKRAHRERKAKAKRQPNQKVAVDRPIMVGDGL
jgi:hypothetical protein